MRKSFGVKPLIYPQPVFVLGTYDADNTPNAMVAAWGGISEADELSMCISAEHKTVENVLAKKAFTVSMATLEQMDPCDYIGIVSGSDVPDKLSRAGFHTEKSELVDAPIIKELPLTVECRLKSYDKATCRLVGEIVNVSADESILTDGNIDPMKLRPITYDGMGYGYYVLGERVGNAFSDGAALK